MTSSLLHERIYISRTVLRGLETCAAQQAAQTDLPLVSGVDQLADKVLREWLAAQPGIAEREQKVREFFKTLT